MKSQFPQLGQRIASGISDIYKVPDKPLVVKVIEADDDLGLGGALVDAVIGKYLHHPNLMPVKKVYFLEQQEQEGEQEEEEGEEGEEGEEAFRWKVGLEMPQAQALDLKLPWSKFRTLLLDLVCAVESMHKAHFWHLDIKPDNVMAIQDKLVLIDFDSVAPQASNWKQGNPAELGTEGYYPKPSLLESRRDIDALLLTLMNLVASWGLGQRYALTENKDPSSLLIRQFKHKDTNAPFLDYKGAGKARLATAQRVYRALSSLVQGEDVATFPKIRAALFAGAKSKRVASCPEAEPDPALRKYLKEFGKSSNRDFGNYYALLGTVFSENKDPAIARLSRTLLEQIQEQKRLQKKGDTPSPRKQRQFISHSQIDNNHDQDDYRNDNIEDDYRDDDNDDNDDDEEQEAARILASLYK